MSFRSPRLLAAANGQCCVLCPSLEGVVACHANQVALGKGTGCKAPDYYTVHLCTRCHSLYDGRIGRLTKQEKRDMWTLAFERTVARLFDQGIILVR